jgi:F0F1-type ATP synthase membrane subunit b/b'
MTSIQRTGIAVLLALLAIFGIYKYGYNSGWGDRDTEMQAEIAKKNEEARAKEQEMNKAVADKETELRKANDVVAQKQTDLNRLIAAGRVRLPSASCVQAPASTPAASGNSNQAPSQPDRAPDPDTSASGASEAERQTLQLIAQIAADGDRAINQLNACVDAYDNMRRIVNGNP